MARYRRNNGPPFCFGRQDVYPNVLFRHRAYAQSWEWVARSGRQSDRTKPQTLSVTPHFVA